MKTTLHEEPVFTPDDRVAPLRPVQMRGKTWGIRERGDVDGTVEHEYECPVHGRFVARVKRAEVPDSVECKHVFWSDPAGPDRLFSASEYCGKRSHWCGSRLAIPLPPGEVKS